MGGGKRCGILGSEEIGGNDVKYDGMCEKCCDDGRGNILIYMLIFTKSCTEIYTITQSIQVTY